MSTQSEPTPRWRAELLRRVVLPLIWTAVGAGGAIAVVYLTTAQEAVRQTVAYMVSVGVIPQPGRVLLAYAFTALPVPAWIGVGAAAPVWTWAWYAVGRARQVAHFEVHGIKMLRADVRDTNRELRREAFEARAHAKRWEEMARYYRGLHVATERVRSTVEPPFDELTERRMFG